MISVPEGVEVLGNSTAEIKASQASFDLKGDEGDYLLVFNYEGKHYDKELSITKEQRYAQVQKVFKKEPIKMITLNNQKLIAMNLFGWKIGWLGTYIMFSLIFGIGLRKLLKIY